MTEDQAREILADKPLVRVMQGTLAYIKEAAAKCLAADIPVVLMRCAGTT